VRESFDYPEGILDGQGTAENGWGGPWQFYNQGQNPPVPDTVAANDSTQFVASDFDYDALDYPEVPHVGRNISSTIEVANTEIRYSRWLAERWPDDGSTYWMSALIQLLDHNTTSIWAGVSLYDSVDGTDNGERVLMGKGWGDVVYSLGSGAPADSEKSTTAWDYGPVWLVGKVEMSGDTLDEQFYMWVNPDPGGDEPDIAQADVSHGGGLDNGFTRIAVHYGDYGGGTGLTLLVDEIRLGTSWEHVSSSIPDDVEELDNMAPDNYALSQNFPNPFNPVTNIHFSIPEAGFVSLKVYNLIGQEVATLVNEYINVGTYKVDFDAANLTSGIYFYKITSGNYSETKKMMLMK
jgi:hypothetical protein